MRIVIAGGHGKIALRLAQLLADRGDEAVALVRNPAHVADVESRGGSAVVLDLEQATGAELAPHLERADAVVFAAGAGPGSGIDRKKSVDRDAAILLADAARAASVHRYLMVSAIGADQVASDADPVFAAYLAAKAAADAYVRASGLDWTILRPGGLTDEEATGRISVGVTVDRDVIARADVALTLVACLDDPATAGLQFELVNGEQPIADALRSLIVTPSG